jgi:hypothetical protein
LADAPQRGLEIATTMVMFGVFFLLVCLGLGIAVLYNISIAAWIFGGALLVLVMVAITNALDGATPRTQPSQP